MLICKAKTVEEALVISDAKGILRNRVLVRLCMDGVEIHNPSDDILAEIKLWCSDWQDLPRRSSKNGVSYR